METPEQIADELVMNEPPPWDKDADQRQSARIAKALRAYADQQVCEALEQARSEIIAVKGCMPCVGMIDLTRAGLITLNADQFVRLPAGTLPLPPRATKEDA